ncbi:DUF2804 domain-containing protein [Aquabacterium sp.]|uniref:DUF2804 domain-containing protein n=1 Tax=Aquabacterium sp. TaxID=1872578 RepID=UPI0035B3FF52
MTLPAAPSRVVTAGEALSGRYRGRVARIDWAELQAARQHSALWRRLHHKRWQYVGIGSGDLFIGVAIVDVGWCCSSFAYLFDRRERRLLTDWSREGLPGRSGGVSDAPVDGGRAWFGGRRAALSVQHEAGDRLTLSVDVPGLRVEAVLSLQPAAPLLLAVGPIDGGAAHATQKSSALTTSGWAEARGRRFSLDGAVSSLDSSNGLLARRTAWRWASAHSPEVGFNLQQGYFGDYENVLWLDGHLFALGAARFEFDPAQPLRPWRVHTDDERLDLRFTPEGARQADLNLGLVASYYIQPVGTFDGWVRAARGDAKRPVQGLLGVTEDHRSKW